jgi:hypothetical protein
MRRTDLEDGEADTLAGVPASPFGPPTGPTVLKFPCRPAPRPVTAAGSDLPPPLDPAPFEPLGNAVAAVVMRLRGGFPRVNVMAAGHPEEESDRQP